MDLLLGSKIGIFEIRRCGRRSVIIKYLLSTEGLKVVSFVEFVITTKIKVCKRSQFLDLIEKPGDDPQGTHNETKEFERF